MQDQLLEFPLDLNNSNITIPALGTAAAPMDAREAVAIILS